LKLRPRDLAKIGMLVLNNGTYNDKQIVSEKWIEKIKAPSLNKRFSYLWWLGDTKLSGKEIKGIIATGIGGQFIYVAPELNLVVVTTAGNFHNNKTQDVVRMVEEGILTAVID